jgi:rod shape-determining protein MreD
VRRALTLAAIIVTALLLQTTVFGDVKLLGARPELMYLVTIVFAMIEGPSSGAIAGFASGMALDFFTTAPKGITALTLTLLGYVVGLARQYIVSPTPLLPVGLVAGGTFVGVLFNRFVAFLLGQLDTSTLYVLQVAALSALYNAILTPLLHPVLRRVAEGSRSRKIVRW